MVTAAVLFLLWVVTAFLPWITTDFPWFRPRDDAEAEARKGVLQQLGTYGDIFGSFNALVGILTGAGVVYALVLISC